MNPVFLYSSKRDEIQKVLSEDVESRLKKKYIHVEGGKWCGEVLWKEAFW